MIATIEKLLTDTLANIEQVGTLDQLKELEVDVLGRKGQLTEILKGIKDLSPEEKGTVGKRSNEIKVQIMQSIHDRSILLTQQAIEAQVQNEKIDVTERIKSKHIASYHPVTLVEKELCELATEMGFSVVDGPEVESEWFNFDALNIPATHPARDLQDTFFIKGMDDEQRKLLLRTQTSSVQVRAMQDFKPPFAIVAPGRVYRNEDLDASHEAMFNQFEGMMIGENISIAHMKSVLNEILSRLFKKDIKTRLRPSFYPFVEPGVEMDIECSLCKGKGCSVCKHSGWVTFVGCGMVHANVLEAGGIDPEKHSGFAFGFGTTRLAMMRYGIDDIRYLNTPNVHFLKQFKK
ncbi:MAG: phenylalanine--tRNA ligase subunit alpha [Patescibacteria group bacterium]|nr:phenylalanine--tRNA ligase subunit alpha [Patescibacteria group bacterium]